MHSIENRFVIGPSNILFSGVYVCTFQPGSFTGWDVEGVNLILQYKGMIREDPVVMQSAVQHIGCGLVFENSNERKKRCMELALKQCVFRRQP